MSDDNGRKALHAYVSDDAHDHWHGFAAEIFARAADHALQAPVRLKPITTAAYPTPARRPANAVLSCDKIGRVYGITPPPWQDSLAACLKEIAGQRP